jgi:hypothetical protein
MAYKGFWDTDKVSKFLGLPSIGKVWIDTSKDEEVKGYGMIHNRPHTEEAKQKMRESGKPGLHKKGTVVSPTGEIVKFSCLTHFCKENKLSTGHVSELLNGKRNTVKGWKRG